MIIGTFSDLALRQDILKLVINGDHFGRSFVDELIGILR
jgi:hypothetical protein